MTLATPSETKRGIESTKPLKAAHYENWNNVEEHISRRVAEASVLEYHTHCSAFTTIRIETPFFTQQLSSDTQYQIVAH